MEAGSLSPREEAELRIPIRIRYEVLETFLREKFIGEEIKTEKDGKSVRYARILNLSLGKSSKENYDLVVDVAFQTLTTLFRNKKGRISVDVALYFNRQEQKIAVDSFELQGKSGSWLMNTSLEALANTFIKERLKKNLHYEVGPHLNDLAKSANDKLVKQIEAYRGLFLSGDLEELKLGEVIPGQEHLLISLCVRGHVLVDIKEISF